MVTKQSSTSEFRFNAGPAGAGYVYAIAAQSDGKLLIGGDFSTVNGIVRNNIARLNSDGSLDSSFNPGSGTVGVGSGAPVRAIVVQLDGKVIIGGGFLVYNGTARYGVARLNADGSLDMLFNPGSKSTVEAIALQSDGKTIIGGGGIRATIEEPPIARLNADGSVDSSFKQSVILSYWRLPCWRTGSYSSVVPLAARMAWRCIIWGASTPMVRSIHLSM